MVTKLTYGSGLGEGLSSFGSSIAGALKERTKRKRLSTIMSPMQPDTSTSGQTSPTPQTTLEEIVGQPQIQQAEGQPTISEPKIEQPTPVYEKTYNNKIAQVNDLKRKASLLEAEGYHPQAQMMMQEAHQMETLSQNQLLNQQRLEQKTQLQKDKNAFKQNEPYFTNIEKKRAALDDKETAIMRIQDALSSGDTKTVRNFLAARMPNEEQAAFIRGANAQQLKDSVKEFFISDMRELPKGGRLNQFLEQNLMGALQAPGKSLSNNQKITEYQIYKNDINKKELQIYDALYDQYLKAGREPPANFQKHIYRILTPYMEEKRKELMNTYKDINDGKLKSIQFLNMPLAKDMINDIPLNPGFIWMMNPKGQPVQIPSNNVKEAVASGGVLIK